MEQPLPAERHRRIEEILLEHRVVRVASLSEVMGVSEVTIRRDLEALERRGVLERTHGGAVLVRGASTWSEPVIPDYPEDKRLIGRAAASLVEPGDALYLNGGSTTLEVFRHLATPGIRVVTNNVAIAVGSTDLDVELLLLGGHYRPQSGSVVGPFATDALRRTHATKAFLGVQGISISAGLTTPIAAEAEIASVMIEQTRGRVIVVADHSKVGAVADFVIAPLEAVAVLVVNPGIGTADRDCLAGAGLEVVVAGDTLPAPARTR